MEQDKIYDSNIELDNEEELFDEPFNPNEVSIDTKIVPMETCLRRLKQGTIILNPDFQRKEVWNRTQQSRLIESLMLKIPLPMFYVSADEENNYTVVDGLQRLSTIRSFILGDDYLKSRKEEQKGVGFELKDLEFWSIYNGKVFNDLPIHIQYRILETEFQFTIINPGNSEEVRRNIFKRINTGGLPLSSQELRNALYTGKSTELLNYLSQDEQFLVATGNSIKSLRMEDNELILRFLSFLIRDYRNYNKTINIDTFLSNTMQMINAMPSLTGKEFIKLEKKYNIQKDEILFTDIDKIKAFFTSGMLRSFLMFDKHCFRRSYGEKQKAPINKALFEMWGVLLSNLKEGEFERLLKNKKDFLVEYQTILDDEKFQIAVSRDSMKHLSVKYRFDTLKELLATYIL